LFESDVLRSELLKGRGTGAPLFLAWCIGTAGAFVFTVVIFQTSQHYLTNWFGFLGGALLLKVWQSILLLPAWWKRIAWVAIYACLLATLHKREAINWTYCWSADLLHGLLLIDARKRVWIWMSVACLANLAVIVDQGFIYKLWSSLVPIISLMVPSDWITPVYVTLTYAVQIVLGVGCALMPPIEGNGRAQESSLEARE
jgi:hypothetical protein